MMIVNIKNLGIVREARIDLNKDLIILTGPNNTGKTYIAYAIYGLMKSRPSLRTFSEITRKIPELLRNGTMEIDLSEIMEKHKPELSDIIARTCKEELPDVFATNKSFFSDTEILIDPDIARAKANILKKSMKHEFGFGEPFLSIGKRTDSSILNVLVLKDDFLTNDLFESFFIEQLSRLFLISYLMTRILFHPSGQQSIFSKELSIGRERILEQISSQSARSGARQDPLELIRNRTARYSLPIRHSLKIAEDLANLRRYESPFGHIADEIEHSVLKGSIYISDDGELLYQPDTGVPKLELHLTASVVRSLSDLVFYFRHLAHAHDFIIIDEPELNLHPDQQIVIARILARIVSMGFRVMLSTHSDYIIREFNSLIMLSGGTEKAKELIRKYQYDANSLLSPGQVGVYLFDDTTRKASETEVTETGFEVHTIDEAINQQNQTSREIFFTLYD